MKKAWESYTQKVFSIKIRIKTVLFPERLSKVAAQKVFSIKIRIKTFKT